MRILHVHTGSLEYPTGIITHIKNLTKALAEKGFEVTVVTKGEKRNFGDEGVKFIQIPNFLKDRSDFKGFDVVHAHDIASLLIYRSCGSVRITTNHTPFADKESWGSNYDWRLPPLRNKLKFNLKALVTKMAGYYAMKKCDRIIAVSEFIKEKIREIYHTPLSKIQVIYNGININDFELEDGSVLSTMRERYEIYEKMILFIKPNEPRKGFHHLINALPTVLKEEKDVKVIAVGSKPSGAYGEYINRLMNAKGEKNKIIFTGKVSFQDLVAFYHLSNMLAFPSIYEGFPITILEAAACGKPVVGFRIGGVDEAIVDGITGILVNKDENELANALLRLLQDDSYAKKLGENARKRVENFGWDKIAGATAQLYEEAQL